MKKIILGSYLLFGCLIPLSKLFSVEQHTFNEIQKVPLKDILSIKINELIQQTENLSGLTEGSVLKNEIFKTWNSLIQDGAIRVSGTDKEIRPCFVALQSIIEQALVNELNIHIKKLNGLIHTPLPATPLCTKGKISPELVDSSIEIDPNRLFTIKARLTTIRDYLFQEGNLYIIYPQINLQKRTEEQLKIYREELVNYPSHLFDSPLNCDSIPLDLIGATYFFQDSSDNLFVFAIQMTQAKDPQDMGSFGLWFGSINQSAIKQRVYALTDFLKKNGFTLPIELSNKID